MVRIRTERFFVLWWVAYSLDDDNIEDHRAFAFTARRAWEKCVERCIETSTDWGIEVAEA